MYSGRLALTCRVAWTVPIYLFITHETAKNTNTRLNLLTTQHIGLQLTRHKEIGKSIKTQG